jgi:hypothetical protein
MSPANCSVRTGRPISKFDKKNILNRQRKKAKTDALAGLANITSPDANIKAKAKEQIKGAMKSVTGKRILSVLDDFVKENETNIEIERNEIISNITDAFPKRSQSRPQILKIIGNTVQAPKLSDITSIPKNTLRSQRQRSRKKKQKQNIHNSHAQLGLKKSSYDTVEEQVVVEHVLQNARAKSGSTNTKLVHEAFLARVLCGISCCDAAIVNPRSCSSANKPRG